MEKMGNVGFGKEREKRTFQKRSLLLGNTQNYFLMVSVVLQISAIRHF